MEMGDLAAHGLILRGVSLHFAVAKGFKRKLPDGGVFRSNPSSPRLYLSGRNIASDKASNRSPERRRATVRHTFPAAG